MHSAPAVQVEAPGGGGWRWLQAALYAIAAGLLGAWAAAWAAWPPLVPALLSASMAGLLALLALRPRAQALRWDGAQWQLTSAMTSPHTGSISVAIDLGPWMLLRLAPDTGPPALWLALSQRTMVGSWHGLRAALYGAAPQVAGAGMPAQSRAER